MYKIPKEEEIPFRLKSFIFSFSFPKKILEEEGASIYESKKNLTNNRINLLEKKDIPFHYIKAKFFVDPSSAFYKDYNEVKTSLKNLAEKNPSFIEYKIIGKSRKGRHIPALVLSYKKSTKEKISILLNGAHHGDEQISTEHVLYTLEKIIRDKRKYQTLLERTKIWFVPIVNPDGYENFWRFSMQMGRKNGMENKSYSVEERIHSGVDLNRNYPFHWNSGNEKASSSDYVSSHYRGESPASEPEVQAMIQLAESERFSYSLSFHSFGTCILFPYTIDNLKNPEPSYAEGLAKKMSDYAISIRRKFSRYTPLKKIYSVDGTFQDYLFFTYGTMALLIESSHQNPEYPLAREVVKNFHPATEAFLFDFLETEAIFLKVRNQFGEALEAEVQIPGIKYYEGEKYTSSPKTGLFFKPLGLKKKYKIRLIKESYKTMEVEIEAIKGLQDPFQIIMEKKALLGK